MNVDRTTILFIFLVLLVILILWFVTLNSGVCNKPSTPPPSDENGEDTDQRVNEDDDVLAELHFPQQSSDEEVLFDDFDTDNSHRSQRSLYSPEYSDEMPYDSDYNPPEPPMTDRGKSPYERRHYDPS